MLEAKEKQPSEIMGSGKSGKDARFIPVKPNPADRYFLSAKASQRWIESLNAL